MELGSVRRTGQGGVAIGLPVGSTLFCQRCRHFGVGGAMQFAQVLGL